MDPKNITTYNEKVDLWSAGCMIYYLSTRKRLFDGEKVNAKLFIENFKIFHIDFSEIARNVDRDTFILLKALL